MAFSKKGTRHIEVNNTKFVYKISKLKGESDWRDEENELNETFLKYARHYGLGMVKDVTINIAVQANSNPISKMFIKCHTLLVDGFMGPEQIIQIKPSLVSSLIQKGLMDGWNPEKKGDHRIEIIQQMTKEKTPVILQLPHMNEDICDYSNLERPTEITITD